MLHCVFWLFSGGALASQPASQPGGGGGFQSLPATQPRLGAARVLSFALPLLHVSTGTCTGRREVCTSVPRT